ncbi:MAG: mandelate racemase/muconate lactonizing enzyme family protein [Chloroflexota bacterium]
MSMIIAKGWVRHEQAAITRQVRTAFGTMDARHAVFLVLQDEAGRRGVGESWVNFPAWAPWERRSALERGLIPWLVGQAVEDVPTCMERLYRAFRGPAQQSGTLGPLLQALCAVELALWDLAAQQAGVPLASLLFDAPRRRVRVYASGINAPIPWALIDQHLEWGVDLFKLKLGFGDEDDRRNLGALADYVAGKARLAVDVNRGWSLNQALGWLPVLRAHEVQWLEEPLRAEEEHYTRELRTAGLVPIAGAENTLLPPGCDVAALAAEPWDIWQPDVTKYAPLHVARRLIAPVTARGRRIIPHFLGSAPGQAASLHLAAGCPDALVEWDINANPLRTDLCEPPFRIEEGAIALPERPGLGWRLKG